MTKRDAHVSIRMPSELRDALRELAEADRRSLADYIVLVLEKHVARKK